MLVLESEGDRGKLEEDIWGLFERNPSRVGGEIRLYDGSGRRMDGTGSGRRRWKVERESCWRWNLELVRERRCLKRKGESGASV